MKIDFKPDNYILGIDLGTSSVKLALVDMDGNSIAEGKGVYDTITTDELGTTVPSKAEQRPEDWIAGIRDAMGQLKEKTGDSFAEKICAIGLSAQMPTMVIIDDEGKTLGNAVVWSDSRANDAADRLLDDFGRQKHFDATGVVLDGHYILPMYLFRKLSEADMPEGRIKIASARDYIEYYLTDTLVTDPSTASGYGAYSLENSTWDAEICAAAGVSTDMLPEITDSEEFSGRVSERASAELGLPAGIPVNTGGADSVCGVFGLGAKPGTICQIWGSSTAILGVTDRIVLSAERKYFITPLLEKNTYAVEADVMASGISYAWASALLKEAGCEKTVSELAAEAESGSEGVRFYPYLAGGEQGVLWDPALKGSFTGLTVNHNLPHLMRALIEGICLEVKRCVDAFEEDGYEYSKVLCTGSVTKDPLFMEILEEIMGCPCKAVEDSGSAYGAALFAGYAGGKRWTSRN